MNIYEIAKEANVSTTTVSRVINSKEGVGNETRKKILKIIENHNFQPRLSANRVDNIAFFYKSYSRNFISNYVVQLLNGVNYVVQDYGYNLLLVPVDRIPKSIDEFKSYCYKRKISAGVFANLSFNDAYIDLYENILPIVTIGCQSRSKKISYVKSDNVKGAFLATDYLIKSGHKNILFLAADISIPDHYERLIGYEKAFEENGMQSVKENIIQYQSQTSLQLSLENLLGDNRPNKPTAAFICDDNEVIRCMSLLEKMNYSIPNDFSIVGFDDYEFSVHLSPPLTTVKQPIFEMGETSARMIINMLENKNIEPQGVVLDTSLIIRKSVAPLS